MPRLHVLHLRSEGDGFLPAPAPPPPPAPPPAAAAAAAKPPEPKPPAPSTSSSPAAAPAEPAASALAGWRDVAMPNGAAISQEGVYLLDGLDTLVLWVGAQAAPAFLEGVFGTAQPQDDAAPLPAAATPLSRALHAALDELRAGRPLHAPLRVVVQGSPRQQPLFFGRLFADGYEPFALHLHNRQVEHYRRLR